MSGFCHCIKEVSFVIFEQGIDDQGKHGHLFFAKATGATYFLIWSKGISPARVAIVIISWLLAILQSLNKLEGFEKHYDTSINTYIIAGIITTFFAVIMLVSLRRTGFFGRTRWMLVGTLTYPLYLLHQKIGFMIFNIAYPRINAHVLFWSTIVVSLISAYFVHLFIERRFSLPMKATLNTLTDCIQRLTLIRPPVVKRKNVLDREK